MHEATLSERPERGWARIVLQFLTALFVLTMIAVFYLAGASARLFADLPMDGHIIAGSLAMLLSLLMLIFGGMSRVGKRAWLIPLLLIVLNIVQHILPDAPMQYVRALHPLNAALMLLLGWALLWSLRRPRETVIVD